MPTHPEAPTAERAPRVPFAASSERGSGLGSAPAPGAANDALVIGLRAEDARTSVDSPTPNGRRESAPTGTRGACAPHSVSAHRALPAFARLPRVQSAAESLGQ